MNLGKYIDIPIIKQVAAIAQKEQRETYIVGGFVRDILLMRPSKDIDLVVIGSGVEFAKLVATNLGRHTFLSVFKNFGTAQIKHKQFELEFVGARKESYQRHSRNPIVEEGTLEEDQNRRDFTINALAISLNRDNYGDLIDPFNGLNDLQDQLIRTPLDPGITFDDDPLRMMRAIRFATQLNFELTEETFQAIKKYNERISIISKERISDELNKIILSPKPSIGFKLLEKTGLLALIFPEMEALKGTEYVGNRGHKDNFLHTLQVLDNLAQHSNNLWLRWAAILHDIGKPATKKYSPQTGWTFHNHNFIGAKMVPSIFKRLKLPLNEKMKFTKKMVDLHMRPIALVEESVTDSAVRRLLCEAGDDIDELMKLCEADITSKDKNKVQRFLNNFKLVREKLIHIEEKDKIRNFQPPISGELIMQTFHLKPCKAIGDIKEEIKEAILEGRIGNNYEEAYQYMLQVAKKILA